MRMLFKKPLYEVDYQDIEKLLADKIDESEILDYKERAISDESVLKQVAAFSNTRGGFLIYGIKESGRGGYPVSIEGIEKDYNTERLDQIIISNIRPRISVQIKKIDIPDSDKMVLVIHIPEGQNCPHYNNKSNKFHKRYNFEAKEMDEHEIEALYQERFFGVGRLAKYVDETINYNQNFLQDSNKRIDGHIIITPLKIDDKLVDTSNIRQLCFDPNDIRFEPKKNDLYLNGFAAPSRYGIKWREQCLSSSIEIHRNGLIHSMKDYGLSYDEIDEKMLWSNGLTIELLQTIQFANLVYSTINFVGKVKIILNVENCMKSSIFNDSPLAIAHKSKYLGENIIVEREWNSWELSDDYLSIGKNIMDELSNHYGYWKSPDFHEGDTIRFKQKT